MTEIKIENKTYRINELPNTENKEVLEFLIYLKELHSICRELFLCLIQENKKVKTTIGFVGSLIDRISESLISIMLLASKGFTTDVAILLVNLIELRTDLKYISINPKKLMSGLIIKKDVQSHGNSHNRLRISLSIKKNLK